jgi:hypothetical protein
VFGVVVRVVVGGDDDGGDDDVVGGGDDDGGGRDSDGPTCGAGPAAGSGVGSGAGGVGSLASAVAALVGGVVMAGDGAAGGAVVGSGCVTGCAGRSVSQHGGHRSEPDEQRRHARKREHDGASADPDKEGTAAFLFVGRFDRFRVGAFWLRCIRRRVVVIAVPDGIG